MSLAYKDPQPEEAEAQDIRDIIEMFHQGKISEAKALELLERARKQQHGFFERQLAKFG